MKNQPKSVDNFDLLHETLAEGQFPVFVYRSRVTQLTTVIVQIEGPIIEGYIALGTIVTYHYRLSH